MSQARTEHEGLLTVCIPELKTSASKNTGCILPTDFWKGEDNEESKKDHGVPRIKEMENGQVCTLQGICRTVLSLVG